MTTFQVREQTHPTVPPQRRDLGSAVARATGKLNIRTADGLVQEIHHRHTNLLQQADGYGYTHR